jgi:hypothetical protein
MLNINILIIINVSSQSTKYSLLIVLHSNSYEDKENKLRHFSPHEASFWYEDFGFKGLSPVMKPPALITHQRKIAIPSEEMNAIIF